ncbi:MAG: hypothetical protein ACI9CA_000747, partial [Natronomonas sp.]
MWLAPIPETMPGNADLGTFGSESTDDTADVPAGATVCT